MQNLYISNVFFEEELEGNLKRFSLPEALSSSLFSIQLQFLSAFFSNSTTQCGVTHLPPLEYYEDLKKIGALSPIFTLIESCALPRDTLVKSWGPSLIIEQWAQSQQYSYKMPPFPVVKEINAKDFLLSEFPDTTFGTVTYDITQLKSLLSTISTPYVLKKAQGYSGKGHFIVTPSTSWDKVQAFAERELNKGMPIIVQPWVTRIVDFSTQWLITSEGEVVFLGTTRMLNNAKGVYQGSLIGEEKILLGPYISLLEEHKAQGYLVLKQIAKKGFYGHIGLDSMIYLENNSLKLCPLLEINARSTMGFLALSIRNQFYPDKTISIQVGASSKYCMPLLPQYVIDKIGNPLHFRSNLFLNTAPLVP